MDYIIHPIIIYLMEVVDCIVGLSTFVAISTFISIVIMVMIAYNYGMDSEEGEEMMGFVNKFKKLLYVSLVLAIFIPSKDAVIKMIVASSITTDTVENALKMGKDAAEWTKEAIIEIVKSTQEEKESSE